MSRCGHNVGLGGDPVLAATIHYLKNPIVAAVFLKHLSVKVFVPVVALQWGPDRGVPVGPDGETSNSR